MVGINLMRKAIDTQEASIKWTNTDRLPDLYFTDNLALLANISIQLQQMTDSLKSNVKKFGLCINTSKTKIQRIGNWNNNITSITVDERLLEKVQKKFSTAAAIRPLMTISEWDLKIRIEKCSAVFKQLQPALTTKSFKQDNFTSLMATSDLDEE